MSEVFVKEEIFHCKKRGTTKRRKRYEDKMANVSKKNLDEAKARNEGLLLPLPPTNKGYEMLHKMGYIPGSGLGKSG